MARAKKGGFLVSDPKYTLFGRTKQCADTLAYQDW